MLFAVIDLSGIVIRDLNGITPNSSSIDWDNISNDNNFYDVIEQAVIDTLSQGDGAFKISFDIFTRTSLYQLIFNIAITICFIVNIFFLISLIYVLKNSLSGYIVVNLFLKISMTALMLWMKLYHNGLKTLIKKSRI